MKLKTWMMGALYLSAVGIGSAAARAGERPEPAPPAPEPAQPAWQPPPSGQAARAKAPVAGQAKPAKPRRASGQATHAKAQQASSEAKPAKPLEASSPAAPAKPPPRRRAVQQIIGSTLSPPASAPPTYGPVLTPSRPLTSPLPSPLPASPQLSGCDGGGCTDTGGVRYNGGVGQAVISPQGRLCNRTGATLQCF